MAPASDARKRRKEHRANQAVDGASKDSFPASDPPTFTPASAFGPPSPSGPVSTAEPPAPTEVQEHPRSDPARRNE